MSRKNCSNNCVWKDGIKKEGSWLTTTQPWLWMETSPVSTHPSLYNLNRKEGRGGR